jgi:hypothetical protein
MLLHIYMRVLRQKFLLSHVEMAISVIMMID